MIAKLAVFILNLSTKIVWTIQLIVSDTLAFKAMILKTQNFVNLIAPCFQNNKHATKSVLGAMRVNGQEQYFSCELYCRTPIFPVYPRNQRISLQMCSYNNGLISAISER